MKIVEIVNNYNSLSYYFDNNMTKPKDDLLIIQLIKDLNANTQWIFPNITEIKKNSQWYSLVRSKSIKCSVLQFIDFEMKYYNNINELIDEIKAKYATHKNVNDKKLSEIDFNNKVSLFWLKVRTAIISMIVLFISSSLYCVLLHIIDVKYFNEKDVAFFNKFLEWAPYATIGFGTAIVVLLITKNYNFTRLLLNSIFSFGQGIISAVFTGWALGLIVSLFSKYNMAYSIAIGEFIFAIIIPPTLFLIRFFGDLNTNNKLILKLREFLK